MYTIQDCRGRNACYDVASETTTKKIHIKLFVDGEVIFSSYICRLKGVGVSADVTAGSRTIREKVRMNENSVQTDFVNLDQNIWESVARGFIVSIFKPNRVWGKGF